MEFDPGQLDRRALYQWLIGCVVPRPIAWITTVDQNNVVNLAPFSFFNAVTAAPPVLSVAIGHREPQKDTLRNLLNNREAVVHLAPPDAITSVHQSGAEYAASISEVAELNLPVLPSTVVQPPRLRDCAVAMECRLLQTVPVGEPPTTLCLLQVVHWHVVDDIVGEDGFPDPARMRAPARLGGRSYLGADAWPVVTMPAQQLRPEQRR